jgi:hypothetical protein
VLLFEFAAAAEPLPLTALRGYRELITDLCGDPTRSIVV